MVLLVLGLSVPAIADVFVYSFKLSGAELEYNADTDAWVQVKPSNHTYVVIQVDSNSPDSVNIWSIDTWKEKDTDTGETTKYYTVTGPDTVNFLQTLIAKKNMWIVEGTLSDSTRFMLSGQTKSTKIGSQTYTVAATLNGYSIYGDIESEDLVGGTLSLTLNSKVTAALAALDEEDVAIAIDDYFQGLEYEPGSV
jgi:hypothetical protein